MKRDAQTAENIGGGQSDPRIRVHLLTSNIEINASNSDKIISVLNIEKCTQFSTSIFCFSKQITINYIPRICEIKQKHKILQLWDFRIIRPINFGKVMSILDIKCCLEDI